MDNRNWLRQNNEPLFPDIIWSKPENKKGAGKILIAGGNSESFSSIAKAYEDANRSGAGTIYLLVPESIKKLIKHIPEIEYASSNPSGSF